MLKQNCYFYLEKVIEYLAATAIVVLSNLYVGPSPRTKIPFFSLSICTDELLCSPKITTFLLQSKFGSEKSERESNPILHPE